MRVEAQVASKPVLDRRDLVRSVVAHRQAQEQFCRGGRVDRAQECEELLVSTPTMRFSDDLLGGDVQCRKQSRRTAAAVAMGTPLGHPGHHRETRLSANQGANFAFLMHTKNQGAIRRVQGQPHDTAYFLDEQKIGRGLEGLATVRLQAKGVPNPHHCALRQSCRLSRRTTAPVCGCSRLLVHRFGNDSLDLRIREGARSAGASPVEQSIQTQPL